MNAVMYIFLNKGAGMSTGKAAAQAGHAAVNAYCLSLEAVASGNQTAARVQRSWWEGGHHTKIVFEVDSAERLKTIARYINDRRFRTALSIAEGHTEVEPFTPTALGVELVDKDLPHVAATFGGFKLYRDEEPQRRKWWRR